MIEHVHMHLLDEIRTNTRTDTIFVLVSILLNLVTLAVNSAIAESDEPRMVVMVIFSLLTTVVNVVAVFGLLKGRQARSQLVDGLVRMYRDNGVAGYYDERLLNSYRTRYLLFLLVVAATGIVAVLVPYLSL
jgi:hypothetical protein